MKEMPATLRFILLLAGGALAVILMVGGVGWLLGWRTATEFSNGFFILGAILAGLGAYSAMGGFGMRGNAGVNFARTASPASLEERNRQMFAEITQGTNTALLTALVGMFLIGIAVLITNLFG